MKHIFKIFSALIFSLSAHAQTLPKNVCALSKSTAQMWLLAGGKLAGATDDAFELEFINPSAKSVGTLTTVTLESIVALESDFVILTQDIPVHKTLRRALQSLGIKCYVADIKNFSDYENTMKDFCALTKNSGCYKKNVSDVKEQIKTIKKESQNFTKGSYVFFRVSATKNKVLKDHFANEIFSSLGLHSIIEDTNTLDVLSVEALAKADPDFIFITVQGSEDKGEEAFTKSFKNSSIWSSLSAVKNGRVYILPKKLFNYKPADKWADAYRFIADILRQHS